MLVRITEDAEQDLELLRYLQEHGVEPGVEFKVHEVAPFNGVIVLDGPQGHVALGTPIASKRRVPRPGPLRTRAACPHKTRGWHRALDRLCWLGPLRCRRCTALVATRQHALMSRSML